MEWKRGRHLLWSVENLLGGSIEEHHYISLMRSRLRQEEQMIERLKHHHSKVNHIMSNRTRQCVLEIRTEQLGSFLVISTIKIFKVQADQKRKVEVFDWRSSVSWLDPSNRGYRPTRMETNGWATMCHHGLIVSRRIIKMVLDSPILKKFFSKIHASNFLIN